MALPVRNQEAGGRQHADLLAWARILEAQKGGNSGRLGEEPIVRIRMRRW
ncbi:MAG TPA: hypothetical protein VKK81_03845 [Candidatus Binatia bacterium]|nr:hypothetical protein [Candidatus Binatia bacterium]